MTEAHYQDRTVAQWLLRMVQDKFPRLKKIWADGGYPGEFVKQAAKQGIDVEIVKRNPDANGFEVLPRRWVVERTFAWLGHCRRLSKDYEYWMQTSDAMVYLAMTRLMARRLARLRSPT